MDFEHYLGSNGSGKTTTVRLLLGLLKPDNRDAEVLGRDPCKQPAEIREHAGALLEHTGLYERLIAEDNLELFGRINLLSKVDRQEQIKDLLTHFDLWERRREKVGCWSWGMKQKLAIARAMLHRPGLILLDEPTAELDPIASASLRDDIAALVEKDGITVFMNTHNLPEAEKLCSLVGVIRNGKLLSIGSPDQLAYRNGAYRLEIRGTGFNADIKKRLELQPGIRKVTQHTDLLEIELDQTSDITRVIS
jgi:ABC-2 type transport system ATP-binding protein